MPFTAAFQPIFKSRKYQRDTRSERGPGFPG